LLSDLSKPIAFWTPLPPIKSGISDYSFELLEYLSKKCDPVAVVDDKYYSKCHAPANVEIIKASTYSPKHFSTNIFQFGNHFGFHGYMYKPLLAYGGAVVLHDLSLFDFHAALCGGIDNPIFLEELTYDNPDLEAKDRLVHTLAKAETVNRLDYPLIRRVIKACNQVFVHSQYGRQFIKEKYDVHVKQINFGIPPFSALSLAKKGRYVTFGAFGGIAKHKHSAAVVKAFGDAYKKNNDIRLIVAGRVDDESVLREIDTILESLDEDTRNAITLRTDISFQDLDDCIASCDVQITPRYPTAGETSATLLRGFAFGKPAIVSPLPQWLEYPQEFCWPLPDVKENLAVNLATKMLEVIRDRSSLARASIIAKQWAEVELDLEDISSKLISHVRSSLLSMREEDRPSSFKTHEKPLTGINAITALMSRTGIAEAARRSIKALYEAGTVISIADYDIGTPTDDRSLAPQLVNLRKGAVFPLSICYLNINECEKLDHSLLYHNRKNKRLVASWWWEFPVIPDTLVSFARKLQPDAILAGSNFVKGVFQDTFSFPVHVIPPIVEVEVDPTVIKKRFSIPENKLVYLISFDANSPLARKNPIGAIDAYIKADPNKITDSLLVVKASHLAGFPEARKIIKEKITEANAILIEDHLSPGEMGALLSFADVYISLHRSEGFGLGMAESMYLGKPVIGTAYSGNTDFLNSDTGCPVGYQLRKIERGDFYLNPQLAYAELHTPKSKNTYWAEPDIEDAVAWIRELASSESLRMKIGRKGRQIILDNYNCYQHTNSMIELINLYAEVYQ